MRNCLTNYRYRAVARTVHNGCALKLVPGSCNRTTHQNKSQVRFEYQLQKQTGRAGTVEQDLTLHTHNEAFRTDVRSDWCVAVATDVTVCALRLFMWGWSQCIDHRLFLMQNAWWYFNNQLVWQIIIISSWDCTPLKWRYVQLKEFNTASSVLPNVPNVPSNSVKFPGRSP